MTVAGVVGQVGAWHGPAESMEIVLIVLTKSGNRSFCFGPLFRKRACRVEIHVVSCPGLLRRPSASSSAIHRHLKSSR